MAFPALTRVKIPIPPAPKIRRFYGGSVYKTWRKTGTKQRMPKRRELKQIQNQTKAQQRFASLRLPEIGLRIYSSVHFDLPASLGFMARTIWLFIAPGRIYLSLL